jgi:hypothetical protein
MAASTSYTTIELTDAKSAAEIVHRVQEIGDKSSAKCPNNTHISGRISR